MNLIVRAGAGAPFRAACSSGAGAGGLALGAAARGAFAAGAENVLKIGFISPRTGALAGFGETDGYVLELARKALASGLKVGGKTYEVQILDRDTQSDPSRASQLAKTLINSDQVDLMLPVSTPETINPVADACEAAGVPCLSTVMPWEAWYFGRGAKPGQPSPFKWTYHFGFGGGEFFKTYVSHVEQPADQQESRRALSQRRRRQRHPRASRAGARKGRLHDRRSRPLRGRHDRLFRADREVQEGEVRDFQHVPDSARFRGVLAPGGAAGLHQDGQDLRRSPRPACSRAEVDSLGELGVNLSTAAYWHKAFPYKSSLTGVSGEELADGYEKRLGKQWTQQLGASMSLFDAGVAALKASGDPNDKAAVAKAMATLNTDDDRRQGRLHLRAGAERRRPARSSARNG